MRGAGDMRKQDLVKEVASKSNMSPRQVGIVVDATFDAIRDAMANGDKVTLTGFGSFEVAQRNEREGRNPRTGEKITIAARKAPQFRPGSELKRAISGE
ncbi:MAG TPA: HU family DNA-binding protein [Thermomicrobiales bacterium]|nr:HU family DNA-binding protein [Thermomicrobiales bacterium]